MPVSGSPGKAAVVKVVTYNVLASCFAHFLKYVPPKHLQFAYRRKRIVSFLSRPNSSYPIPTLTSSVCRKSTTLTTTTKSCY